MIRFRSIQICISVFFILLPIFNLKGQVSDTVWIKSNQYFVTKDTSIYFNTDTFLLIPANLKYKLKADKNVQTQSFYDSVYSKSKESWIKSELYGFVFRKPVRNEDEKYKTLENSQDPFKEYKGKIIGDIYISNLNFLYSVTQKDSIKQADLLNKSVASAHITTYKSVIEKNLTFEPNEKVNPFILAENERILRQLSSIEDARITIVEKTDNKDTVDVIVTTVDVFPLGLDGGFSSLQDFKIGFYHTNILGTGVEWKNLFIYKTKYDPDWGYEGKFKYNNIYGTFINAAIYYESTEPNKELRGVISRDLTITKVNAGGAIDIGTRSFLTFISTYDSTFEATVTSNYQDYWLGYKLYTKRNLHKNMMLKARYFVEKFTERPYVDVDSNYIYHKKRQYFSSLAYYNIRYLKSKYILGFGITEDVPYGLSLQATGGYETSEFFEYPYIGFDFGYAKYFKKIGYFQVYSNYGGYIDGSQMINEVFKTNIKTFSNLFSFGDYKLREFISVNYVQGFDIFDYHDLRLHKYVQGLRHESIKGNIRVAMGSETVIFTPWYWYGFRVASSTLLEVGFVGKKNDLFDNRNFHSGIGTGLNIRNESLVFSTFSFRISYYTGNPNYNGFWGFNFTLSDPKFFRNLTVRKPGTVIYE
jgi:hypothetical protein